MKQFWKSFFGRAVIVMAALDVLASLALLGFGKAGWLLGAWGAAVWFLLNAFLLWRMSLWAVPGKTPEKGVVFKWVLIKFPVLYLIGLGFLLIPGVSLYGVLVTFTAFLAGLAAALYKG
jgi:hypothetical protein